MKMSVYIPNASTQSRDQYNARQMAERNSTYNFGWEIFLPIPSIYSVFSGRFPGYLGSRPAIGFIVKIIAQPVLKR
jgi:hypothetical protein